VLVVGVDELLQVQRSGQGRRPGADEEHVDFQYLSTIGHVASRFQAAARWPKTPRAAGPRRES
jgi:hypothetical protein